MTINAKVQEKSVWALDPAHSSVEFSVKHMVIATVKGQFGKFEVDVDFDEANPERSSVDVTIDAASLTTKNEVRDTHLRSADFFEVDKHPHITFKSRKVEHRGGNRYDVVGDLTIRGVAREVVLAAEFGGTAKSPYGTQHAGFAAETAINRKEFGLTWNAALETGGMMVGDQVKIGVEVELVKQAQNTQQKAA